MNDIDKLTRVIGLIMELCKRMTGDEQNAKLLIEAMARSFVANKEAQKGKNELKDNETVNGPFIFDHLEKPLRVAFNGLCKGTFGKSFEYYDMQHERKWFRSKNPDRIGGILILDNVKIASREDLDSLASLWGCKGTPHLVVAFIESAES